METYPTPSTANRCSPPPEFPPPHYSVFGNIGLLSLKAFNL